jgi:hypothetical protein
MARITAEIALGLTGFVFLVVLACVILNSFDVHLSEQAKVLLTPPHNPYPAEQNLYFAIAGLESAGERPIIDMGQARIAAYNQAVNSILVNPDTALELNKKWDAAKLAFTGKLELGPQRTTSIWSDAKSRRPDIAAALASNQKLYQRYLSLHPLHGYYETARPSSLTPIIFAPQEIRVLFLSDLANRIQTGNLQTQREALTDLGGDLQTWRTVLKGDGTLIGKMLATAYLHGDLILLADFIEDPASDLRLLDDALGPLALPFDPKDYKIGNAYAAEFRVTAAVYETITAPNAFSMAASNWWSRMGNAFQAHFFKLNATENTGAAIAAHRVSLGNSDPGQFSVNLEAYRESLAQNEPHLSPAVLYNPIGKILVKLAENPNDGYYLRAYDVAAYQRLVYLLFQLKRQHIATADVPAFLKTHPDWSTHPVDGKPFRWNPQSSELAVNTLGDQAQGRRFSVTLR